MECCYPTDCGEYTVTPMLVAPANCPTKCCQDVPVCLPCLPRCSKKVVYCCEKKRPKAQRPPECCESEDCCHHHEHKANRAPRSPSPRHRSPRSCEPECKPVKTKYVIPCYRYEDGRVVSKLPVTAFKRNGMQDQEHSKLLGAANFLSRCPRDVSIEFDVCTTPVRVGDPAKVPPCIEDTLGCCFRSKKPIEVDLEDILDDY